MRGGRLLTTQLRTFLAVSPFGLFHSLALLALDSMKPVGFLSLGKLLDGKMNINYTGVQKHYRRRGVSLALKVEATELAKRLGAKVLTTQNHEENPMLKLNRTLGFRHVDACVVFERKL